MFCPKCGSILMPKKENNKKMMACSCGYKTEDIGGAILKETVAKSSQKIEVVDKGKMQTLPKTTVKCPKCGHDEAYYWLVQTRAGDEPETKFLRCVKCEHTWRSYD